MAGDVVAGAGVEAAGAVVAAGAGADVAAFGVLLLGALGLVDFAFGALGLLDDLALDLD